MKTYSIAGLKVNMECSGRSEVQAEKYLIDYTDSPDITIKPNDEYVKKMHEAYPDLSLDDCHYIYLSKCLNKSLLDFDGLVLHSSAVAYENKAYLFSADSGTGKSTHTGLWKTAFEGAYIVNDDKPIIRLINGKFYVCGTPFSGSSALNENVIVPLQAICFIERDQKNSITLMENKTSVIYKFLSQTIRRAGNEKSEMILSLLDKILKEIPVYNLKCLPNIDAAILAHEIMSK